MLFKKTTEKKKLYEIGEVIEKFGMYQVLQYLYISVPTLFYTMANINYIFVMGDVSFRCKIPECEVDDTTFLVPWWPNGTDRCSRPILANLSVSGQCSTTDFTDSVVACTEFVYEHEDNAMSVLNLACRPWQVNSVGTIHNLAMLLAMPITGWITDRYGRKPLLVISMVATVIGVFKMFAISYSTFIAIEILEAFLSGGGYSATMLIMIEITGMKYRILSGIVMAYAIYMGEAVFAILPMFFPYWKTLVQIIYIPSILWLALIWLMHESPRWQIVNGKTKEAIKNLQRIAKTNKMELKTQNLDDIDDKKLKDIFNIGDYEKRESFREIIQSKEMMKRLLVGSVSRFTSNFVYYGLMINSVWLPGDKYVNFLLSTVASFPGELISMYLMNKIGRKLPLIIGFIISGAVCVVIAFIPDDMGWAKVTLFVAGKTIVSACFTGAITYSMELFPTSARGSLLGLCAFYARLGGMLAPLTPILNNTSKILPPVCFGAAAVITGLLTTMTPETKLMPLMDTIKQAEDYVSKSPKHGEVDNLGFTEDVTTRI